MRVIVKVFATKENLAKQFNQDLELFLAIKADLHSISRASSEIKVCINGVDFMLKYVVDYLSDRALTGLSIDSIIVDEEVDQFDERLVQARLRTMKTGYWKNDE